MLTLSLDPGLAFDRVWWITNSSVYKEGEILENLKSKIDTKVYIYVGCASTGSVLAKFIKYKLKSVLAGIHKIKLLSFYVSIAEDGF